MLNNLHREIIFNVINTKYSNDIFYIHGLMKDTNYTYGTIKYYIDELLKNEVIKYVKNIGNCRMYQLTNNAITNIRNNKD